LKKSGVTGTTHHTRHHHTTHHHTGGHKHNGHYIEGKGHHTNQAYVFKPVPERPNTGCFIVFEQPLFRGKSFQVCSDSYEKKNFKTIWTKPIGSAKVGESTTIDLYEKPRNDGRHIHLTADIPNFPLLHYTYTIQAVKVKNTPKPGCTIVYTKTNFNGKSAIICSKSGNTSNSFHGKIRSIKVNPKTFTVIYQNRNLLGRRLTVTRSERNLIQKGFNTVWSIQNYSKPVIGCIIIFAQSNFRGNSKQHCHGQEVTGSNVGWNHKIGSIKVAHNTHVTLFNRELFAGPSLNVSRNEANIPRKFHNKQVFSLKVEIKASRGTVMIFNKSE